MRWMPCALKATCQPCCTPNENWSGSLAAAEFPRWVTSSSRLSNSTSRLPGSGRFLTSEGSSNSPRQKLSQFPFWPNRHCQICQVTREPPPSALLGNHRAKISGILQGAQYGKARRYSLRPLRNAAVIRPARVDPPPGQSVGLTCQHRFQSGVGCLSGAIRSPQSMAETPYESK